MYILENYKHNLNKSNLLFGQDIVVHSGNRDIVISLPKYKDTISHYDFSLFVALINADKKDFEKYTFKFTFKDKGELIKGLMLWSDFSGVIQKYFKMYIKGIEFEKNKALVNGNMLTSEEYEIIAYIILVSLKVIDFKQENNDTEDKEEQPKKQYSDKVRQLLEKEKLAKERLQAAKQKQSKKGGSNDFEDYFVAISYEFGLGLKEIQELTPYALYWYISYLIKIDYHKVQQIAAGNGLIGGKKSSSKYKNFLDN